MLQLTRIVPRWGLGALLLSLPLLVAGVAAAPAARRPPVSRSTPSLSEAAHGLLVKRCFQCHAAGKASGLDLRTQEGALRGGSRGPALLPGNPAASPLYRSVTEHGAPRMPPAGPLPAAEQELLRQWIAAGASWPAAALESPGGWAFRRLTRPPTPHVRRKEWARNPIDAFILAKLEAKGLSPAPPADRRTLIRRLYFDLIGLPPTPEAIDAFLKDRAPDAYGQLVERLLQSPRYGERWARHWLDVARFSESQGFERDKIRDHAWRYRDYVIRAFNADMPYDRFVREQIAGDVLPGATRDSLIATGFLVAGPWDEVGVTQSSAVMRARVREDELEDMVGVVGQSFLGLTVHCARCHDHKFDPIPQRDYYRLQAALADVRPGDRALPAAPDAARRQADVERLSAQVRTLEGQIAAVDAAGRARAASRARVAGRAPVEVGAGAVSGAVRAPQPIARWSFEGDGRDTIGGLPLALTGGATLSNGRLRLDGRDGSARSGPLPWSLSSRTLEAWVDLGALDQRGGGVMTIEDEVGRVFDAITYGERQPRRWAAGSNGFLRTIDLRGGDEATPAGTLVHVAVTYGADDRITVYRNGQRYADS
ncbi:MAG TPA: DUF1549 domain-containing protein, partial [Armatimonadota bacterium]|nr:DUF1549 domain-containing protein [Armatimonadota bacterium]